jgi:3-deoxy-D-manno-octulosonic-acid transferase
VRIYSPYASEKVYSGAGMYITYTFVLTLGLILTFPYYLIRFRKYMPTIPDRLGFLKLPQLSQSIWVHAVSVGEVKATEVLVERLRRQFPGKPVVVSTATPAGQQLARLRSDIIDHTFYFPIDLPFCVARTLGRVDPQMVIIAETEIWPNFLRACRERRIPVVMINGRISDRSFGRYLLVRRWLSRVFADYTVMGMQSEMDRERIQAIGADPRKVTVFGNLKYDLPASARSLDTELASSLRNLQPLWIAASTLPGEEELVLDAFAALLTSRPALKLMIAPRHADRFDSVEEIVKRRGFTCARRSRMSASGSAPVLLLDSIGELAAAFEFATVVFMGGSLVARGGHNVLEPARFEKPIVFGPHMENFRDIASLFLNGKAAIQVQSASELSPAIERILSNPQLAAELGKNAQAIVEQNTGATNRVLRFLQPAEARR